MAYYTPKPDLFTHDNDYIFSHSIKTSRTQKGNSNPLPFEDEDDSPYINPDYFKKTEKTNSEGYSKFEEPRTEESRDLSILASRLKQALDERASLSANDSGFESDDSFASDRSFDESFSQSKLDDSSLWEQVPVSKSELTLLADRLRDALQKRDAESQKGEESGYESFDESMVSLNETYFVDDSFSESKLNDPSLWDVWEQTSTSLLKEVEDTLEIQTRSDDMSFMDLSFDLKLESFKPQMASTPKKTKRSMQRKSSAKKSKRGSRVSKLFRSKIGRKAIRRSKQKTEVAGEQIYETPVSLNPLYSSSGNKYSTGVYVSAEDLGLNQEVTKKKSGSKRKGIDRKSESRRAIKKRKRSKTATNATVSKASTKTKSKRPREVDYSSEIKTKRIRREDGSIVTLRYIDV